MMKQSPLDRIREQAELSGCHKGKAIYPPLDFEAAHQDDLDKVIMDIARLPGKNNEQKKGTKQVPQSLLGNGLF